MSGFQIQKNLQAFFSSKSLKKRLHARTMAGRAAKSKALMVESLERRELMAADVSNPLHNALIAQDVNGDFAISPIDVLQVINAMNRQSNGTNGEASPSAAVGSQPMVDVNNDGFVSPIDALMVINRLRTGEGVGELADVEIEIRDANGTVLNPTNVGGVNEYTIAPGAAFTLRTKTRDLRNDATGVFSTYADIGYAAQGGSPTTELVEVQWGEYQTLRFSSNSNGGTFTLTYGSETTNNINYSANAITLRNNIVNAVGALPSIGGVANVRGETFEFEGSTDRGIGLSFVNARFRQNIADVAVGANNLTSNNANPATITTTSSNDPTNRGVLGAAITYPLNQASGGATFNFTSGRNEGTLVTVPNTRLLLDNVGNFTGAQPTLDDGTAFLNVFDTAFRASSNQGVVDFTVGPTGDSRLGVGLFGSDVIIPDNQVEYPAPFRIRIEAPAVGVNAVNDTFAVNENSSANVLNVLANDILVSGNAFLVTAVTQPTAGGTAAVSNGGASVLFTPTASFSGTTEFTYTITNNAGSDTATVTINVNPVNDSPVAITSPINVNEDSPATNFTPSQLFSPGPGEDTQTVSLGNVSLVGGQTGGTVVLQGGNVVFTPTPDFNGTVLFVATGTDNGSPAASTTATFTVNVTPVNDAPVATGTSFNTPEDTALTINPNQMFSPGPANESSQSLTLLSANPDGTQSGGTISIVSNAVSFTPTADFNGTFVFVAVVRDNGTPAADSQPSTITINVTPVNDAPTAVPDTGASRFTVQPSSQNNQLNVLANDLVGGNDPGDTLQIVAVTNLQGPGSIRGTLSINPAGNRVIYTPPALLFNATETFSYTIRDGGGLESTAAVEVFIAEPPRPFALNDTANVEENGAQISIDVLANDEAKPGATKQLLSIDPNSITPSGRGTIVRLDNGTAGDTSDDKIGFTPSQNFNGLVTFTYQFTDTGAGSTPSTGTVTVNVGEFNDPPTAQNKSSSTDEDTPLVITEAFLLAGSTPGGTGEESQTVTVLNATLLTTAAGTLTRANPTSGAFTFTPALNYNGPATVTFTLQDNGTTGGVSDPKTATATLAITVLPVNDQPSVVTPSFTVAEDSAARNFTPAELFSAGPSDESSQTVSLSNVSLVSGQTGGTVSLVGGSVRFTPAADFNGSVLFVVTGTDTGSPAASRTATFTVNVTPVNDAPVPTAAAREAFVNVPVNIDLTSELAQASRGAANESTQTVRINRVIPITTGNNPTKGTVTLNNDGTITYVAPTNISTETTDVFDYEIIDNGTTNGASDPKTGIARITITIKPFQASQIGGRIWVDENNNGVYDRNELYLDGLQVVLSGQPLGAASRSENLRTLSDGSFNFGNLAPGTYTVSFVKPTFLLDAPEIEQATFTIDAPGGRAVTSNFRVLGINNVANALWENQLSTFYLRNGQEWAYRGYTALVDANGQPIWNMHRGGFEAYREADVSLNMATLTPIIKAITPENALDTFTVSRGQYLVTRVDGGNYLIRVLAIPSQLPVTRTSAAEGEGSSLAPVIDSVFANDEWDD